MVETELDRRGFLSATGIAGVTLFAGCSSDGGDGGDGGGDGDGGDGGDTSVPSEVDDYLSGAMNYEGEAVDATGEDSPTVEVGAGDSGLAFGPAAIRVSAGTTVTWEWTGAGGAHNVVAEDGEFESGNPVTEPDEPFEHAFEEAGNALYFCDPHKQSGMKGAVIVE